MKLSKQEIFDLFVGLNGVGDLPGVKFAYAVSRNLAKIKPEIEALQKANLPSESYLIYDKARAELAAKFAVKDKDGKATTTEENGTEVYLMADKAGFEKELEELRNSHKEAIEGREKQAKDFEELLKEETEVDLYMIPLDYVPEGITANLLKNISSIIKEN